MKNQHKKQTFAQELARLLVQHNAISAEEAHDFQTTFAQSDSDQFEEFIIDEDLVDKEKVLKALGDYYKVPFIDVTGEFFDHMLLTNFPKDFLLRHAIIPLQIDNDELVVIASDPSISGLASAIERFSNNDVIFMVGVRKDIIDAVEEFYDRALTEVSDDITSREEDVDLRREQQIAREEKDYEERRDDIFRTED